MFGQQNNQDGQQGAPMPDQPIQGVVGDGGQQPPIDATPPVADPNAAWQHPGAPIDSNAIVNSLDIASTTPPAAPVMPPMPPLPPMPSSMSEPAPETPAPSSSDPNTNELIDIKQQALSQLSPLVGQLDQSPEDKFRTTMMMIQASDDQTLIRAAYEAAQKIEDEKTRAQALLDIVNEINYFTQHHEDQA